MDFTIRKVVLYPEIASFAPRVIAFEPGRINIITGTSQRGKSAVSKIIDYCLGASKCAIPVGIIRESVSWFGIEVSFKGQILFIARKSPKNRNSSSDCFVLEYTNHDALPLAIEKNTSLDSLKSLINERLGLPNITLQPNAPEAFNAQPSYRDLVAFNYLPQHIVANPYTLFFRTEKTEYRERLTRMFPLALGIVDNQYYLLLSELESFQKHVSDLTKEVESIKSVAEKIRKSILPYINEAKELGLIEKHFSCNDNLPKAIDRLKTAVEANKDIHIADFLESQTSDAVEELVRIIGEEDKIAKEIEKSRRQLTRYRQLTGYMASYSNELNNQTARVGILGWFRENISEGSSCILCGKPSDFSSHESEWLKKMADSIESESKRISQEPIRLEKDVENIRRHIENLDGQLTELKKERVLLESQSEDAEKARLSFQQLNQFIGRMQQAIASIEYSDTSSEISLSLEEYKAQLSAVRAKIAKYQIKKNQDESLFLICHHTKGYANHLELERSNSRMEFDLKELMLGFYSTDSPGEKEKPDYLYEIGSGENWMGYHIAFFLSLHEKFIDVRKSPVFSFLIIDQPTQVYFPSADTTSTYDIKKNAAVNVKGHDIDVDTPTLPSGEADTPEGKIINNVTDDSRVPDMVTSFDVDVTKARRIFEVLSQSLKSTKEQYQIIVTEHADEDVWGGIDLIHKVADWRGDGSDSYLIPPEWMNIADEATSPQQPTEDNADHSPGLEKETDIGLESSPRISSADTLDQEDSPHDPS